MKDKDMEEFERLAKPLVDFLRERFHPLAQIIITDREAQLVEATYGVTFPQQED